MKKLRFFLPLLLLLALLAPALRSWARGPDSQLPTSFPPWTISTVEKARLLPVVRPRSLALDAEGNPHIAYGGNQLYYIHYDGAAWQGEILDTAPSSDWPLENLALAVDAAGYPHIAYLSGTLLRYAYYDGITWQIQSLGLAQGVPAAPAGGGVQMWLVDDLVSLVLDQAGNPHIFSAGGGVTHTYYDGASWHSEVVDAHQSASMFAAADAAGYPHVNYCQYECASGGCWCTAYRYAWYDGTAWQIQETDRTGSLVIDAAGGPHMANVSSQLLYHSYYDGTFWQQEIVDTVNYGGAPSLAIDLSGGLHVSYCRTGENYICEELRYAWRDGQAWQQMAVETIPNAGMASSLAMDAAGRPHIAYSGVDDLRYAYYDGTTWQIQVLDEQVFMTGRTSLALDSSARPHVAYCYARTEGGGCTGLRYAYYTGSTWQHETVTADSVINTALALGPAGLPGLAYGNWEGVYYVAYDGSAWQVETLDDSAPSPLDVSLAVDGAGQAHVSYGQQLSLGSNLQYAHQEGAAWLTETVDSGPLVGQYISLALDSLGRPHIAYKYTSGSDQFLKYAWYDGTAWQREVVGPMWTAVSLVLDTAGLPHIAYGYNGILYYTWYDGGAWQTEAVTAFDPLDEQISLALDSLGRPHISYNGNQPPFPLYYAHSDGTAWHVQQVSDGRNSSLAVNAAGQPRITFVDVVNWQILYADGTCTAVSGVDISGPTAGLVDEPITFVATVQPISPTQPVTLTWSNGMTGTSAVYSWPLTGTYTVTVTATNACGGVQVGTVPVRVLEEWPYKVQLPVILNGAPLLSWSIELLDTPREGWGMGDRSLVLDPSGQPHYAYGRHSLYYASYDGAGWQVETVETTADQVGSYASLAFDAAGHPHISYADETSHSVRYAYHDGTVWHAEYVDASSRWYPNTALVLDPAGRPHILYSSPEGMKHAYHDGTAWQYEVIDPATSPYLSLTADAAGQLHAGYCQYRCVPYDCWCEALKYAHYDGSAWQVETVNSTGWGVSIALDSTGRPNLSYTTGYFGELHRAYWDGAAWQDELVAPAARADTALSFDPAGRPHIAYSLSQLMHAFYDGASWQNQEVDPNGGGDVALAVDAAGGLHVSYLDIAAGLFKYAHEADSGWQIGAIDRNGTIMGETSLALDAAGYPHTSYLYWPSQTEFEDRQVRYGYQDGSGWYSEAISPTFSANAALALDSSGRPHLALAGEDGLRYAVYDGAAWQIDLVDSAPSSGFHTFLALDATGLPHITYSSYELSQVALCYAWYDGTAWYTQTVEILYMFDTACPSLALDAAGYPHIAYSSHELPEFSDFALRYAWYDGTAWYTQTVEALSGDCPSLALDVAGRPHIAYQNYGEVRYAFYDGTSWQIETVDPAHGSIPSLALDAAGYPHIAYGGGQLHYAWFDGLAWHIEIADEAYQTGGGTSLALDAAGRAHITYVDLHDEQLRYAVRGRAAGR